MTAVRVISPAVVAYCCLRSSLFATPDAKPNPIAVTSEPVEISPSSATGPRDTVQLGGSGGERGLCVAKNEHPDVGMASATHDKTTMCFIPRAIIADFPREGRALRCAHSMIEFVTIGGPFASTKMPG